MDLRSALGSLQLPVALLGALLVVGALTGVQSVLPIPDRGGLPGGLALVVLYVVGWLGFVLVALGLAIPPGDGFGVRFNRWQRRLFVVAAVAALASGLLPVLAFGVLFSVAMDGPEWLAFVAWVGPALVAVVSLASGIAWRTGEAVARRVDLDGTADRG